MKKLKYIKYLFLLLLLMPISVSAATINCSAPESVTLGDTFTVTFSGSFSNPESAASVWFAKIGSSDNVTYQSGSLSIDGADGQSLNHSVSFKATAPGQARFYTYDVNVSDGNQEYSDGGECYINIVEPAPVVPQASINNANNNTTTTNNNSSNDNVIASTDATLKSLSVVGYELNPAFNKDVLEYKVLLKSDTTKIKIDAQANDENAVISGIGEIEVKNIQNKVNIVVALPNGTSKTYVINFEIDDKDKIEVVVNDIKYTIVKKITGLAIPEGFEFKTIKIKDIDVESFYNKKSNLNLVYLKDEKGNTNLYVYDMENDKYVKYFPVISKEFSIIVLSAPSSIVPKGYSKSTFNYNGEIVNGYSTDENSKFRLIYGINTQNGKKDFYLYDTEYQTLQRFIDNGSEVYSKMVDKCTIAFYILGGFIVFLIIIIIILLSKNVKFKKRYLSRKFGDPISSIDSPVIYKDIDASDEENDNQKKKKKKSKEKTFLDE